MVVVVKCYIEVLVAVVLIIVVLVAMLLGVGCDGVDSTGYMWCKWWCY